MDSIRLNLVLVWLQLLAQLYLYLMCKYMLHVLSKRVFVVSDVTTTITHAMIFCVCVAYLVQTGALSCRSSVDHSVFTS